LRAEAREGTAPSTYSSSADTGEGTEVRAIAVAAEMACDPDAMTRVYHHVREVEADIPRGIGVTQRSFEEWRLQSIDVFDLIREADLLVVRDEEHDGVSFLRRPAGVPRVINHGSTGVARHVRRQGIALGRKGATAAFAPGQWRARVADVEQRPRAAPSCASVT
jgi:hypothetical protein